MRFQSLIRTGFAVHLLLGAAACSHAAPPVEAAGNYQLVDLGACKKPQLAAPALPKDSYERYGFTRRFVDLDSSGNCVLMEFWIERLGGNAAAGMRTLEHRFLRVAGGKWAPFETELKYFPLALKDRRDNKIYMIDAPTAEDVGDKMVVPEDGPRVLRSAGWQEEAGFAAELKLEPVDERRAEVLQALAKLLEQRLPATKDKGVDQARIRMLRTQANNGTP
jgi:hypothetical protein